MEEALPSVSISGVGSRFVSQNDIESAKARRDEQWKAAYARLGQEPPPQPAEDSFDGRSLAEKLAANRAAKQEEWEEKTKLANQFRALEEDEIMFLDSIREKQAEEERLRNLQDGEELMDFKKAVVARENAVNSVPPPIAQTITKFADVPDKSKRPNAIVKKDAKKSLKGVLVKKKPKAAPTPSSSRQSPSREDDTKPAKRRKIAES
ncbi:N-terminal domain of NEFA-interacting nuclear protein NIP30-domain-containing protein [Hygrophoropsis aurantiaca]|uniref:N-terminal domain of NEFA-interacting nuclear protein NIP30-domain-containing protein n=1 Tax=Hygrophoropsis aurantiaca TaxID=72124 RepID=A0ACB8AG27_9AGAM|nr:N-terminal domain of NEFA-interacting nuclear protein NIP30-domain-containing protein [Hygrophoropsis aurantiaca]